MTNLLARLEDQLTKFNKDMIGFDNLMTLMLAGTPLNTSNYPPYNLRKVSDEDYEISVAVAGFTKDDLKMYVEDGFLIVDGEKKSSESNNNFLFKGIADRNFRLRWTLADYIEVKSAEVSNGILTISLKRELPETMKPKTIEIK